MHITYIQRRSRFLSSGPDREAVKLLVQQDFAKADVYFQSLNVESIKQEKKYTVRIELADGDHP